MVRVVIADDHAILVEGLRSTLASEGIEVVGSTGDGADVVELVDSERPDVVLLDLGLPRKSGFDCLREIRERAPQTKVIVLSGSDDQASISQALELGAICFIGKGIEPADLAATVRITATNQPIYRAEGSGIPGPSARPAPAEAAVDDGVDLTRREREILLLVSEGHSNAELAKMLWVTEQTVKFHLSNIYRKLEVGNRTQAAAKARDLGFTDPFDDEHAKISS